MDQTSRRLKLALDTVRVETFEPQAVPELQLIAPPTRPGNTFPPCCSDVLVCA